VLLYAIRTIIRVEGFCLFLLRKHAFRHHARPAEMAWLGETRGLDCDSVALAVMDAAVTRWRRQLDMRAFPMLAHWARHATNEQRMGAACIVYAHLAYFYRNTLENSLDRRAVSTLLTSQIFLNVHYAFDAEPDPPPPIGLDGKDERTRRSTKRSEFVERHSAELGVAQTELCDVFAQHRGGAIRWLESAPASARADVLEAVVRTITFTRSGERLMTMTMRGFRRLLRGVARLSGRRSWPCVLGTPWRFQGVRVAMYPTLRSLSSQL